MIKDQKRSILLILSISFSPSKLRCLPFPSSKLRIHCPPLKSRVIGLTQNSIGELPSRERLPVCARRQFEWGPDFYVSSTHERSLFRPGCQFRIVHRRSFPRRRFQRIRENKTGKKGSSSIIIRPNGSETRIPYETNWEGMGNKFPRGGSSDGASALGCRRIN